MEREDVLAWLKENKRLAALFGTALCLLLALQFKGDFAAPPQAATMTLGQDKPPEDAALGLHKEYKPAAKLNDPFKLRSVRQEEKTAPPSAAVEMKKTGAADKKAAPVLPVLRGVAGGNGRQVAIIELGVESKVLQPGEMIGAYELLELKGDSVSLKGPQGLLILRREGAAL